MCKFFFRINENHKFWKLIWLSFVLSLIHFGHCYNYLDLISCFLFLVIRDSFNLTSLLCRGSYRGHFPGLRGFHIAVAPHKVPMHIAMKANIASYRAQEASDQCTEERVHQDICLVFGLNVNYIIYFMKTCFCVCGWKCRRDFTFMTHSMFQCFTSLVDGFGLVSQFLNDRSR